VTVEGDPARLAQIVGNLLNNASKFTPRGGHARLTLAREGNDAVLSVNDDGIGIAPDQLRRIFEPFAQVDTSLGRTQSGLGIGLTLVKTLVEMHGGRVEARSGGSGRGSEFVVRLPMRALPPVDAIQGVVPPVSVQPRRILIVDDNRDSARSLAMLMTLGGHEVHLAHDGLEAVSAAATVQPDVVLLDIGLPKLDGYQAARRIRERAGARHPILIAITGWGQDKDRRRAEESGFDAHMVKPVDHRALSALLAEAPRDAVPPNGSSS
jgi:CheY-like chemotaxis protein